MPEPPPIPDLLLARRAAAGQPAAWDEIVDLYGGRLWNLDLPLGTVKSRLHRARLEFAGG